METFIVALVFTIITGFGYVDKTAEAEVYQNQVEFLIGCEGGNKTYSECLDEALKITQ